MQAAGMAAPTLREFAVGGKAARERVAEESGIPEVEVKRGLVKVLNGGRPSTASGWARSRRLVSFENDVCRIRSRAAAIFPEIFEHVAKDRKAWGSVLLVASDSRVSIGALVKGRS